MGTHFIFVQWYTRRVEQRFYGKKYAKFFMTKYRKAENRMTYTYCMRKDKVHDERQNEHTTYGIEAIDSDGETVRSFPDVFFDRQRAERFVRICNEGGLSSVHLPDVLEDALVE